MRDRAVLEVGDDLLHDGVGPVRGLGGEHRQGGVGEHRVVAVDGEQLALVRGVQVGHAAHDQPGGDVLGLAPGGEGGVGDFGDLGVGDPPLLVFVVDGVGVVDGGPRVGVDGRDRRPDSRVLAGGDREPRAGPGGRGDHLVAVERRVRPQDAHPGGAGGRGGDQRVGHEPGRAPRGGRGVLPFYQASLYW